VRAHSSQIPGFCAVSKLGTAGSYAADGTFMWTWIVIVGAYAFSIFFFHILGGIASASDAIQSWGRRSAERAIRKSGESPGSYARSRLSRR
jgi:hypothetical protein